MKVGIARFFYSRLAYLCFKFVIAPFLDSILIPQKFKLFDNSFKFGFIVHVIIIFREVDAFQ
jgi:hypothetical protein